MSEKPSTIISDVLHRRAVKPSPKAGVSNSGSRETNPARHHRSRKILPDDFLNRFHSHPADGAQFPLVVSTAPIAGGLVAAGEEHDLNQTGVKARARKAARGPRS